MTTPNHDVAVCAESLAEHMANINLTDAEEDELLCGVDDVDDDVPADAHGEETHCEPEREQEHTMLTPEHTMLLDAQLVYHRGRGSLIKELAYRMLNSPVVSALNMIHDADDVPDHLVIPAEDGTGHYDVHTGLKLEDGECLYDDKHVASILNDARVVFVKGANKKRALMKIFDRVTGSEDEPQSPSVRRPIVINVDGHTADDEDRQFCKSKAIHMATFSFPFVYTHMHVYEKLLYYRKDTDALYPGDFLYVSNVLAKDTRYKLAGKGRIVCICYNDHSRGGTVSSFDKEQRCSLLNMSILDHLWLRQQDALFRELVRNDPRRKAGRNGLGSTIKHRRGRRERRQQRGDTVNGFYRPDGDEQRWRCYYGDYERATRDGRYGQYDYSDEIHRYYRDRSRPYYDDGRGFEQYGRDYAGQEDLGSSYNTMGENACHLPALDINVTDCYRDWATDYAQMYGRKRRDGDGIDRYQAKTFNGKRRKTRQPASTQRAAENHRRWCM